jgi:hypothetical protein
MASSNNITKLSDLSVRWEWEGDKSVWQQFPLDIQQEISQAFDAGKKEVK